MSSPRRLWMGDSAGQPCGCHWSTAGSTETLQLDAGFGMHPPEEGSVCVTFQLLLPTPLPRCAFWCHSQGDGSQFLVPV